MKPFKTIAISFALLLVCALAYAAPHDAAHGTPRHHLRNGASANWAGYAVETNLTAPQDGAITDVKGSWVVPRVDCSAASRSYASLWLGMDGYSSPTVEQIGTDADCSGGTPSYYAWYEMYPNYPVWLNLQVSPGDNMYAQVTYIGNNTFRMTIADRTTGRSVTVRHKAVGAKRSSAEWIIEAPSSSSGVAPLSEFGTVPFQETQVTVRGAEGGISDARWQHDAITMVSTTGVIKALPSSLFTGGAGFNLTWQHS